PPPVSSLSLHDALPIYVRGQTGSSRAAFLRGGHLCHLRVGCAGGAGVGDGLGWHTEGVGDSQRGLQRWFFYAAFDVGEVGAGQVDRKSTRLNSSHVSIS